MICKICGLRLTEGPFRDSPTNPPQHPRDLNQSYSGGGPDLVVSRSTAW